MAVQSIGKVSLLSDFRRDVYDVLVYHGVSARAASDLLASDLIADSWSRGDSAEDAARRVTKNALAKQRARWHASAAGTRKRKAPKKATKRKAPKKAIKRKASKKPAKRKAPKKAVKRKAPKKATKRKASKRATHRNSVGVSTRRETPYAKKRKPAKRRANRAAPCGCQGG